MGRRIGGMPNLAILVDSPKFHVHEIICTFTHAKSSTLSRAEYDAKYSVISKKKYEIKCLISNLQLRIKIHQRSIRAIFYYKNVFLKEPEMAADVDAFGLASPLEFLFRRSELVR